MTLQARMADSVSPFSIPELYESKPNGVAAYYDGKYAWSKAALANFDNHWMITVIGDPAKARHARVIDVERGDVTPEGVDAYQKARAEIGGVTIVYCDRSTVPEVMHYTPGVADLFWWIATLDDIYHTPAGVADEIYTDYGVTIAASQIVAIQWANKGSYDQSSLWAVPHWSHPAS